MEAISKFYLFYYSFYFKVVFFGGEEDKITIFMGYLLMVHIKDLTISFQKGVLKRAVEV